MYEFLSNASTLNCFGALILAQDRYGIGGSVQLRIWINVIGLLFLSESICYLLSVKPTIQPTKKTKMTPEQLLNVFFSK